MSKITKWLTPVWHRVLYSCTHVAKVGVRGLNTVFCQKYQSLNINELKLDMIQADTFT